MIGEIERCVRIRIRGEHLAGFGRGGRRSFGRRCRRIDGSGGSGLFGRRSLRFRFGLHDFRFGLGERLVHLDLEHDVESSSGDVLHLLGERTQIELGRGGDAAESSVQAERAERHESERSKIGVRPQATHAREGVGDVRFNRRGRQGSRKGGVS